MGRFKEMGDSWYVVSSIDRLITSRLVVCVVYSRSGNDSKVTSLPLNLACVSFDDTRSANKGRMGTECSSGDCSVPD